MESYAMTHKGYEIIIKHLNSCVFEIIEKAHKGYEIIIKPYSKNHFTPIQEEFAFECPNKKILKLINKKRIGTHKIELLGEMIEIPL
jgi:hypothetical protein